MLFITRSRRREQTSTHRQTLVVLESLTGTQPANHIDKPPTSAPHAFNHVLLFFCARREQTKQHITKSVKKPLLLLLLLLLLLHAALLFVDSILYVFIFI